MLVRNRTTRLSYLRNLKMSNKQKSPKDFNINNPAPNAIRGINISLLSTLKGLNQYKHH